jgi:Domain of unknown function (DUF4082)
MAKQQYVLVNGAWEAVGGPPGNDSTVPGPQGPPGPPGAASTVPGPEGPPGPAGPSGQSAGKVLYYAVSDSSDIATYKTLLTSPSAAAEQTIATSCTGTNADFLVASFATDPGAIGAVDFPAGTAYRRIYASVNSGTARFHLQVYKRSAAGVETLIRDEYSDNFIDQTVALQMWTATTSAVGQLLDTDRIVNKLYAQRITGGGGTVVVTTYFEGSAHTSQIQTTISAGAQGPVGPPGPAGSTILSGTATPTASDGAVGDYYLDTDDRVLYGPKITGGAANGPAESVYGTTVPGTTSNNQQQAVGNDITFSTAGQVTGFRVRGQNSQQNRVCRLWNSAGTQIATGTIFDNLQGWLTISITAVPITAGTYRVSFDAGSGGIVYRTPHAAATSASQSLGVGYLGTLGTRPTDSAFSADWFCDVVFQPTVNINPWPVALKSVPPGGTAAQILSKTSATDYAAGWSTAAAAGSTILSGTATPTAGTGAVGDYYLDTDDRVLYGPKVPAGTNYGGNQSYYTTEIPAAGGAGFVGTFGQDLIFAKAGQITALRYYRWSSGGSASTNMHVYDGATEVATAATSGESNPGWYTAVLSTPYKVVTANKTLRIAFDYTTARAYPNHSAPGTAHGDISLGNMWFKSGIGYPNTDNGSGLWLFVDVVFQASAPDWPVALKSVPPGGTTGQVLKKLSGTDYDWGWVT